jgi:hypothetical protein
MVGLSSSAGRFRAVQVGLIELQGGSCERGVLSLRHDLA